MKKLNSMFWMLCMLALTPAFAQIQMEGTEDYGRLYGFTYDLNQEDRVYASTLGNHILVSDNNGQDWEVLYTFPENGTQIWDLRNLGNDKLSFYIRYSGSAFNNTLYIFDLNTNTIEAQVNPPSSGGDTQWVDGYDIQAANPDVMIFAQGYKIGIQSYVKVYYTSNGGASWNMIYDHLAHDEIFVNTVAVHPTDAERLYIGRGVGPNQIEGGLWVSDDAGSSWTEKTTGMVMNAIAFDPADADHMYAGTGSGFETTVQNLYESTDGGDSWAIVPISWDTFFLDTINYIVFNPADSDNVVVLEGNEVAITTDGGANWTNHIYAENPDSYFYGLKAAFNPNDTDEVLISADFHPQRSTDGANSMSRMPNEFFHASFVAVSELGDGNLYYGVQRGMVNKNMTTQTESHHYVQPINLFFSDAAPVFVVDPQNEGRMYIYTDSFSGETLRVSNDHGATTNAVHMTEFDRLLNVKTAATNPNIAWAGFEFSGTVSIDFSNMGSPVVSQINMPSGNPHWATWFDPTDADHVMVAQGGEIYQSNDNGATWTLTSTGLDVDPSATRVFALTQSSHNDQDFLLATDQGLYRSTNGGNSWELAYGASNVGNAAFSTQEDDVIVLSIYSGPGTMAQLVFSNDNGESWIEVPMADIEFVGSNSMVYTFGSDSFTAYLATYDLGVISIEVATEVVLGIGDNTATASALQLYPNPTNGVLNLQLESGKQLEQLSVYSTNGRLLMEAAGTDRIDLSSLQSGVYLLEARLASGDRIVKRVVKN